MQESQQHRQICELGKDCQQPASHVYYIRRSARAMDVSPDRWACEEHLNRFMRSLGNLSRHVHVEDLRQLELPF